jgi:hypothetical protein
MAKNETKTHKGQHWVSQAYMKPWCDASKQEPFLHIIQKDGSGKRCRSPSNAFRLNELYTLPLRDGGRDLSFEELLSKIEGNFVEVRRQKLEPYVPITHEDRLWINGYMSAQLVRTPLFRDHHAKQWADVVKTGEEIEAEARKCIAAGKTPPVSGIGQASKSITLDEAHALRDHPLLLIAPGALVGLATIFSRMSLAILCTRDRVGFITSDAPCVAFDPEWHTRPPMFQGTEFRSPTVEVTLPISPGRLALLSWRKDMVGYHGLDVLGEAAIAVLDEMNRRTRGFCDKEIVVKGGGTKPVWFDLGSPDNRAPAMSQPPSAGAV